jgi:hypothetical protein
VTNQLEIDLSDALMRRIFEVVADTLDTARRGGMTAPDRITMALTVMVAHTMTGMLAANFTEREMLQMCLLAFRDLKARKARAESEHAAKPH